MLYKATRFYPEAGFLLASKKIECFWKSETGKGGTLSTKLQNLVLITILFLIPIGCQDISSKEVIIKNGLLYKIGESDPFTGIVRGYSREGYRSCKMKYEKKYKNGIRQGNTKFWYPNGKLESVEPYSGGTINGVITRYYKSGKIKSRIHIVDDQRGGSKGEQFWDENESTLGLSAKHFSQ